jgi:hypothetical protein
MWNFGKIEGTRRTTWPQFGQKPLFAVDPRHSALHPHITLERQGVPAIAAMVKEISAFRFVIATCRAEGAK